MATVTQYLGTGRRKKSVARVRLLPGSGNITINKRDIEDYFGYETLKMIVRAPMVLTDTLSKFDVNVNVYGGGYTGHTLVGQSLGSWMGFKTDGVFHSQEEVDKYKSDYQVEFGQPGVGRIKYVDANGDARDGIVLAQHGQKRGQKHDGQIVDAVKTEIFERM